MKLDTGKKTDCSPQHLQRPGGECYCHHSPPCYRHHSRVVLLPTLPLPPRATATTPPLCYCHHSPLGTAARQVQQVGEDSRWALLAAAAGLRGAAGCSRLQLLVTPRMARLAACAASLAAPVQQHLQQARVCGSRRGTLVGQGGGPWWVKGWGLATVASHSTPASPEPPFLYTTHTQTSHAATHLRPLVAILPPPPT